MPIPVRVLPAFLLASAACLPSQAPDLRFTPTAQPGRPLPGLLLGPPLLPSATLIDDRAGRTQLFGETLWLGLSPALAILDAGPMDPLGSRTLGIATPPNPSLAGIPLYLQSFVFDQLAPNGLFRASNGQSAILHATPYALVSEFRDPVAEGFTGNFDATVKGRLQAAPVRVRTKVGVPSGGVPFGQPIIGHLNPNGARAQHVYRAVDLGATGEEELLTEIAYKPLGTIVSETYTRLVLAVTHSHVVPDYRLDPWSQLPLYPNSGLDPTFAKNYKPLDPTVDVYDGPFQVAPGLVRPDGYLPYPQFQRPFVYEGSSSIVVEFKSVAWGNLLPQNGAQVHLMVLSSPQPNARALSVGAQFQPLDPFTTLTAKSADNSVLDLKFEFRKVTSTATSPFLLNPGGRNYQKPYVAAHQPPGTVIEFEFEGAQTAQGGASSGWMSDIRNCAGYAYLRYRVRLSANPWTSAVPSIDTIVFPVQ